MKKANSINETMTKKMESLFKLVGFQLQDSRWDTVHKEMDTKAFLS